MKHAQTAASQHRSAGKPITYFRFGPPPAAPASMQNLLAEVERLQAIVSTQNELIERLHVAANRDAMTGLANRRGMEMALSSALSDFHRYGHKGAVLLLDLNRFKLVNDTYGHAAGDALLMHVADVLRRNVRESDTVARLGGDEFLVILREVDARAANTKALELRHLLTGLPCHVGELTLHAAASIGVATFSEAAEPRELLSLADQRMYLAKNASKRA
ncbi:MAG: GGDEF domain-containing protein [Pseudomonadaceae bacterium]|nr:GGDEF domain-containing protein [Pseudomonadaceae bacterium]